MCVLFPLFLPLFSVFFIFSTAEWTVTLNAPCHYSAHWIHVPTVLLRRIVNDEYWGLGREQKLLICSVFLSSLGGKTKSGIYLNYFQLLSVEKSLRFQAIFTLPLSKSSIHPFMSVGPSIKPFFFCWFVRLSVLTATQLFFFIYFICLFILPSCVFCTFTTLQTCQKYIQSELLSEFLEIWLKIEERVKCRSCNVEFWKKKEFKIKCELSLSSATNFKPIKTRVTFISELQGRCFDW